MLRARHAGSFTIADRLPRTYLAAPRKNWWGAGAVQARLKSAKMTRAYLADPRKGRMGAGSIQARGESAIDAIRACAKASAVKPHCLVECICGAKFGGCRGHMILVPIAACTSNVSVIAMCRTLVNFYDRENFRNRINSPSQQRSEASPAGQST